MADDAQKNDPIFASGDPHVVLPSEMLPKNPKRVVRTYASDLAKLNGTPQTPRPAEPQTVAPAAAPAPKPIPPPIRQPTHTTGTLSEAVSRIQMPQEEEAPPPPSLPPLTKRPEPAPVARVAPPPANLPGAWDPEPIHAPPAQVASNQQPEARIISETIITEQRPSLFSRFFSWMFGARTKSSVSSTLPPTFVPPPAPKPAPAPAPIPPPAPVPQPVPTAPAPSETEDREAILARLRARVQAHQAAYVPPPVFPTPMPEAAPKRPAPAPRPLSELPLPDPTQGTPDRLHTYTDDFANRIETQRASAFSVLAAQSDAQGGTTTVVIQNQKESHAFLYAIITTVLVVGGSTLLYFAFNYWNSGQPVQLISSAPQSLITGDDQTTISGTGTQLMNALAQAATSASLPGGNVRVVYLSVSTTTKTGGAASMTEPGGSLIAALNLPAPSILLRNIDPSSTVGIIHAGTETRPFFILGAQSYERTFAGMLSWEPTMAQDLALLYPAYLADVPDTASSTGTSTPARAATTTPASPANPAFVDEVVESHDVRALKDGQGRTIILYGYRDQQTLIIARDEEAFTVLLARLSAQ